MNSKMAAVTIDGRSAKREIHYKITAPSEGSDSNVFSDVIGGRFENTELHARRSCVDQANDWVRQMRADGFEISAWDAEGNTY